MTHTPTGDRYYQEISPLDNCSPSMGHRTRCSNNTRTITKRDRGLFRSGVCGLTSNKGTEILGISITTRHPRAWGTQQTPYDATNPPPPPKPHHREHPLSIERDGQMIIKFRVPHKTTKGDYPTCLQRSSSKYWGTYPSNNV